MTARGQLGPVPEASAPEDAVERKGPERVVAGGSSRLRTLAVAFAVLLVIDVTVGIVAGSVNARADRVELARDRSEELREHQGPTMLVLGTPEDVGNVRADQLESALSADGNWAVRGIGIDGGVALWQIGFDELFVRHGQVPDVLVIPFGGSLEDPSSVDWSAVGNHYTSVGSLRRRLSSVSDSTQRLDIVMSWASSLVGNRRWLFSYVTDKLVPSSTSVPRVARRDAQERSFEYVERLVADAVTNGSRVVLVAAPTRSERQLPEEALDVLRSLGVEVMDLRWVANDPDADFNGATRLVDAVAEEFSERIVRQISGG